MNTIRKIALLAILAAVLGGSAPGPAGVALDPALRRLLSRPASDDAGLLSAAQAGGSPAILPRGLLAALSTDGSDRMEVFLETDGRPPGGDGVEATAMGERLYAARVTLAGLRRLVNDGALTSARLARPVWPALDQSGPYLGLPQIRRMDQETGAFTGVTGRGVVIGIADSGIDWLHPDFRDLSGHTRLYKYWDQTEPLGTPPAGYPYGYEYDAEVIDQGTLQGYDIDGHGTHVLGIAAGNGRASLRRGHGVRYAGIAPEATLVAVRTNFTEVGVALAVRYIFRQADALGLPAVVNLSLGNQFGPHRGDTPFERSLRSTLGPGRLLVAAAGNDAQRALHAEIRPVPGETIALRVEFPDYTKNSDGLSFVDAEAWFDARDRYALTVVDPDGIALGPIVPGDTEAEFTSTRGIVRGWNTEDQGFGTFLVEIEDNPNSVRRATGTWTLRVEPLTTVEAAEMDWWVVNWRTDLETMPRFLDAVDAEETVISPATAPEVIAVGAISTRSCWTDAKGGEQCYEAQPRVGDVAAFTSRGPTSDGRQKPEIYAPGYGIVSARSSALSDAVWTPAEILTFSSPDRWYWTSQGTSMAAPQVTGTVALLLQRFPRLTFDQAVARLDARGESGVDQRTGLPICLMRTGAAVAPIVLLSLSEAEIRQDGIHVSWYVGKEQGDVRYRVYKAFSEEGPYQALSQFAMRGRNPYEVVDVDAEPGRLHVYRVAVRDEADLEEDLDTLRVLTPGSPQFMLRAPDPNPARDRVRVSFYVPASPAGGVFRLEAFDTVGRHIRNIGESAFSIGGEERLAVWDLTGDDGRRVPAGVYFLRMTLEFANPVLAGAGASMPPSPHSRVRRVVVLP